MSAGWTLRLWSYTLRSRFARLGLALNAVLLAGLTIVLSVYWIPSANERDALRRQVDEVRRTVTEAMQARELAKAYAGGSQAAHIVERKLQASAKQAELVQHLGALARRRGVRIVSESYEEGKRQSDYTPLFVQITLEGSYASIRDFLREVSTLPLWAEVQDARIERRREPTDLLKAQLRLRAVRHAAGAAPKPAT